MNKALLTKQDVKNFILEALKRDKVLTRKQLMAELGISHYMLNVYIKQGLPWFGSKGRKQFILSDVKKWFWENNIKL